MKEDGVRMLGLNEEGEGVTVDGRARGFPGGRVEVDYVEIGGRIER